MKIDIKALCKYVLKRWWILVLALVIGAGTGVATKTMEKDKNEYSAVSQIIIDKYIPEGTLGNAEYSPNLYNEKLDQLMDNVVICLNDGIYLNNICEKENVSYNFSTMKNIVINKKSTNIIEVSVTFSQDNIASKIVKNIQDTAFVQINSTLYDNIDMQTKQFKSDALEINKVYTRNGTIFTMASMEEITSKDCFVNGAIYGIVFALVLAVVLVCIKLCSQKIVSLREMKIRYKDTPCLLASTYNEGLEKALTQDIASNDWKEKKYLVLGNYGKSEEQDIVCEKLANNKKILKVSFEKNGKNKVEKVKDNLYNFVCSGDGIYSQFTNALEMVDKNEKDFDLILFFFNDLNQTINISTFATMVDRILVNLKLDKDSYYSLNALYRDLESVNAKIDSIFITK